MQFNKANPGGSDAVTRDRWGRPMLIPRGETKRVPFTRVTTIASTIEDTRNLTQWQLRMLAVGLSRRPDLQALVGTLDPNNDKTKLNAICDDAKEAAAASSKSNWGTAIHSILEAIDKGDTPAQLPPEIKPDILAYLKLRKRIGFGVEGIEKFVANSKIKTAGTADRLITMNGKTYVADIKSGSVAYGQVKIAAQLAMYAISSNYDIETDEWGEGPVADARVGFVIHIPHGEGVAQLIPVQLATGLEAVKTSLAVRELRKAKPFEAEL